MTLPKNIKDARFLLDTKKCTALEMTDAYLKEIEKKDKDIHAYLEVYDSARDDAKRADEKIAKGEKGMLLGIPMALKDNLLLKGKKASSASKMLENYKAPYTATAVQKLLDAGVVFLGRTNMDEFAMGSSTENSAFGATKNPHDIKRVPGGTSGGSAAAVASGMALAALGSDTGGSIRQPASFCGTVGLKPTYGNVSRYGLMAMGSSLDCIGPLTHSVSDAESIFSHIKGNDSLDMTSLPDEKEKERGEKERKYTIGVPSHFLSKGVDEGVLSSFYKDIDILKEKGHTIKEINLPALSYALSVYYIIMFAEVSSNLARFDGVRYGLFKEGENGISSYKASRGEGFGKEVQRRILLGTFVLSSGYYDAYYGKAMKARNFIRKEMNTVFESVDAIALPTAPTPAFKIGEKTDDPLTMYLEDIFTVPANITGVPALSLPSFPVEREGKMLPIGIQFMARHRKEDILFSIGKSLEEEREV
jgi:aspartyl-tRNA(Asn)/glutamyl-tRNA(Gln) amidotransferase subunit A